MYESASYIYCIVHKYKSKHNTYVYESIHLYIHTPFIYTERRRCLVRTTFAIVLVSVLLTHSLSLSRSRTFNLSLALILTFNIVNFQNEKEGKQILYFYVVAVWCLCRSLTCHNTHSIKQTSTIIAELVALHNTYVVCVCIYSIYIYIVCMRP